MDTRHPPAAFFDLGGTLGAARLSPQLPHRIERLVPYPQVPAMLERLSEGNVRLGILSSAGQGAEGNAWSMLEEAGLSRFFEPNLLVFGDKGSPATFAQAAERAGHSATPERCVYVGEDRDERSYALEVGLRAAPHPRLAREMLDGERLRYVRVSVPEAHRDGERWREAVAELPVVPIHVTGEGGTTVYAIATSGATSRLDDLGFEVLRLGDEDLPLATAAYLLRDDRQARTGFLAPEGEAVSFFGEEESRWVLASSEGGLYVALPARRSVEEYHFEEAMHGHNLKLVPGMALLEAPGPGLAEGLLPSAEASLSREEVEEFRREITSQSIAADVERYGESIRSRHVQHEHNALAVADLLDDLKRIGDGMFLVGLHRFTHEGRGLDNVEAELPGREPNEIVLVTAHLDSTAQSTTGYDPRRDEAPGVDDDGSGIAAVLAAARTIKTLSALKQPKRTIRFVLFNAEEHGLVGSKAYAGDEAALEVPIVAVYQMDMIGYNRQPPRTYEVHAGVGRFPDVEQRSLALAETIGKLADLVSPDLPAPQIYLSTDPDPAEGRSDHASFQLVGYPACVTSEDFFAGPHPDSPQSEGNPNYHKTADTFVDPEYAADIARAVAAAAWVTANS